MHERFPFPMSLHLFPRLRCVRPCSVFRPGLFTLAMTLPFAWSGAVPDPVSKVFFAAVSGDDVFVHQGNRSQPVTARETYNASGLGIQTGQEGSAGVVFSNGLAAQLQSDSRIAVTRFSQEPFRPDHSDLDAEPSISNVALDLAHGTVVLATSKLAAGSKFEVLTPRAAISIQGGTMIVTADAERTRVSVVTGGCILLGRGTSLPFRVVTDRQIANLHPALNADAVNGTTIEVARMTDAEADVASTTAWDALRVKRTVYFEQKAVVTAFGNTAALLSPDDANGTKSPRAAFDLVPVQLSPRDLPLQYTISLAQLLAGPRR